MPFNNIKVSFKCLLTKKTKKGFLIILIWHLRGKKNSSVPKCTISGAGNKKKGLCWNFLTGRCKRDKGFKHVHARPSDLSDKLVSQFALKIAPGVAKAVEDLQFVPSEKHAKTG